MTFTPGVYLYNRDAVYGHLNSHDTFGLVDWAQGAANNYDPTSVPKMDMAMEVTDPQGQYFSTTSPSSMYHRSPWPVDTNSRPIASSSSSTSSSSSYVMTSQSTWALSFAGLSDLARQPKSTAPGPLRSPRVSKQKTPSIGCSGRRTRHKSDYSQHSQSPSSEHARFLSSASSATSPTTAETLHRQLPAPARARSGGGVTAGSHSTTGHGGNHNITLRTASRRLKPTPKLETSATSATPAGLEAELLNTDTMMGQEPPSKENNGQTETLTLEERRVRQNHNIVEKQYRNRLNSQFERLLSILPANRLDGPDMGQSVDLDDRRMSKAEVLKLARRRIYSLNDEIQKLNTESESLRSSVQTLNLAIQGGQQMEQQQT
ncbi:hypothetical protein SEPCBS57363_003629 [Sporothrix epigloea]|uniref:BHLH domain-containing protein n=1 Tax=Sporothrix epigloea TaxID=1892477 RepID=A0ABP0DRQ6_9PEZI